MGEHSLLSSHDSVVRWLRYVLIHNRLIGNGQIIAFLSVAYISETPITSYWTVEVVAPRN